MSNDSSGGFLKSDSLFHIDHNAEYNELIIYLAAGEFISTFRLLFIATMEYANIRYIQVFSGGKPDYCLYNLQNTTHWVLTSISLTFKGGA